MNKHIDRMDTLPEAAELEQAARFEADLRRMLKGQLPAAEPPPAERELLTIGWQLSTLDFSGESRVRSRLRARLAEARGVHTQRGTILNLINTWNGRGARIAAALAITLIALSAFMVVPPLRSFAQDILEQVGIYIFTNEPTQSQQIAGQPVPFSQQPTAVPPGMDEPAVQPTVPPPAQLSVNEANAEAGFDTWEPEYLPAGYRFAARDVVPALRGAAIYTQYDSSMNGPMGDFLQLTQTQTDSESMEWPIGDAQPEAVTVNGVEGLWIEAAPTGTTVDENHTFQVMGINILTWEQDGFYFTLQSPGLTLDELLKVAASLR